MTTDTFHNLVAALHRQPRFSLGEIVITRNARQALHPDEVFRALGRHASGDWGELGDDDRQENELSLRKGFHLLSAYNATDGAKFWIITEADRAVTTVLLPNDY